MSSAKSNDEHGDHLQEPVKKEMIINGSRPSPLKIHKDSRSIHKQQHRQPVIIYAHSPKVIHTQARDFMALVQRLTGLDKTSDDNDSSSVLTEENSAANVNGATAATATAATTVTHDHANVMRSSSSSSSSSSQLMKTANNNIQHDAPIFTPNSFCSPRPVFRFSDSPTVANSLSPSFLEFMKGLPDY